MATAVTYQDLQQLSCEFEECAPSFLNMFIEEACLCANEDFFGSMYDTAVKYLAAHLAAEAREGSSGAAGPITRKKAGELELAYSPGASSSSAYGSTVWGRRYESILRKFCFKATIRTI